MASLIIVQSAGNTQVTEGGSTDSYTIVLDTQPTADVVITLNGGTQLSPSATTLTFTAANWNVAQTVTVTAINDTIGEGPHFGAITATSTSTDPIFNGLSIAAVPVTIADNDIPTTPRAYTEQTGAANPFNGIDVGVSSTPTFADIDGDGDLDAIVGESGGTLKYYKNTGSSTAPIYTVQTGAANPFNGIDIGSQSAPTLADLDGDGDLDAIVGAYDGRLKYYKNTGSHTTPTYTLQTGSNDPFNDFFLDVGITSKPTLADIDGDGDLDAIVGERFGSLKYWKNTGSNTNPVYVDQGANSPFDGINIGFYATPNLVDLDGDGDLDLIVGERDGNLNYYKNTGSTINPVYTQTGGVDNPFNGIDIGYNSAPTFADLDGDGDLDAIVGEQGGTLKYFISAAAPTVTSGGSASFAENDTGTVYTVIGANPNAGTTLSYSISGTDAALFNIDSSTGVITFKTAPNFEAPTDNGTNNVYNINVTASFGSLSDTKAISITVTNVNDEVPTITSGATTSFAENGRTVYTVTGTDADAGTTLSYSISGTDAALFNINSLTGAVTFKTAPNFEVPNDNGANNIYDINVIASDGSFSDTKAVAITVTIADSNIPNPRRAYLAQLGTANPFNGIGVGSRSAPTFADLDGDGDLDAIIGAFDGTLKYYKNTGSATNPTY